MWNNILNTLKKGDQKAVFQEMLLAVKRWKHEEEYIRAVRENRQLTSRTVL
jgi:hypothetical protein